MTDIEREAREPLEGLMLVALLLVSLVCGMLLERRLSSIETRLAATEQIQEQTRKRQDKADLLMFGHIG